MLDIPQQNPLKYGFSGIEPVILDSAESTIHALGLLLFVTATAKILHVREAISTTFICLKFHNFATVTNNSIRIGTMVVSTTDSIP